MKSLVRKILTGNTPVREYATITVPDTIRERVFLEADGGRLEVTHHHWVLCLEPLVFGVWIKKEAPSQYSLPSGKYRLIFTGPAASGKKLAVADLSLVDTIREEPGILLLLKITRSRIRHINYIRAYLLYNRYFKKPGLTFEKLKRLVTAYSFPRKVRIISWGSGEGYNIFPMDLVGELRDEGRMVFGLRHSNRTLGAILESGKLAATEVPFHCKDIIYKLGSHHSTAPPALSALPFPVLESVGFGYYIPALGESYREIRIIQSLNLGSHMLLWGEILNETIMAQSSGALYHIHFLHYLHYKKNDFPYRMV